MPKATLGYWNIRGLAQNARLLAAYTGFEIQETRYTQWNKWHGEDKQTMGFDFPNLPYLIDGQFKLTQSAAISQYIILKTGHNQLLGKTAKDRARVDNIIGVLKDALKQIKGLVWNKEYPTLKAAALQKAKTKLDYVQKFVGNNKFALGYLTLADFQISESSFYFEALYPEEYLNWSFFQTIRQNFNNLPAIANYYKSQNAMIEPFMPPQMVALQVKFRQPITLGYWGIRGLAHPIRLLLSYVNLPFTDKIYTSRQQWFENDKNTLGLAFPNIPYLIDGGFKLTQSGAIIRYVANRSQHKQLLGKNIQDTVRIQMILGLSDDAFTEVGKFFWKEDKQGIKAAYQKIKPKFQNLAKFIGDRSTAIQYLTIADFIIAQRSHFFQFLFPEEYKNLQFFHRIRDYINSLQSTKAYYARQGSIKGPFMPPAAFVNPSWEQYK